MHVAPYALIQPLYWFFILQYIPASLLLARCYERTNSIWCSIFFHMLVNGVSISALNAIG
jgi:membrane protease YdiL (CAAX protease family)